MAERLNATVLKTVEVQLLPGFESLSLRQVVYQSLLIQDILYLESKGDSLTNDIKALMMEENHWAVKRRE